jgi:short-subunit dehydrogenase
MNLGGRTALVTGATGGVGTAIARGLWARGVSRLLLSGRRTEVLEPLASELGGRALECDLSDPAAVDRLADEAVDVDVLVANAALPASGHLTTFTQEEIDRALAVNLRAPMALARRLVEPMIARGSGHLVFMASLSAKTASPGGSVYSATKFGLRGFALALRQDLRPHGVGVSVVSPGFIRDAGMFHDSGAKLPPFVGTSSPEQVAKGVVRAIERNRAEVEVAPLGLRAGAAAGGLLPELAANVQRRLGGDRISEQMAEGQRPKR